MPWDPGGPPEPEEDVRLRDGRTVRLRPIAPADADALRSFHHGLSPRTVYLRFFTAKPELLDDDVERFTHVDNVRRVAYVAVDAGELVGVGRFDDLGDGSAEVAFVVRDDLQGHGLGPVLLDHLVTAGRARGIERFVAEVLPGNTRMLAMFHAAGYPLAERQQDGVTFVSFPIGGDAGPPSPDGPVTERAQPPGGTMPA